MVRFVSPADETEQGNGDSEAEGEQGHQVSALPDAERREPLTPLDLSHYA